MKKYLAYDAINSEYEEFETLKESQKYLEEAFLDKDENEYHPNLKHCKIYIQILGVDYDVIDKKSNYKYESEEDIPDGDDDSEAWPFGYVDEVWRHKFVNIT
ncbi:MAG: hypothetical protein M0P47_09375 [Bacteroidales bacterium]|nr:hypothetical protein [Bacteroidales bacterium]